MSSLAGPKLPAAPQLLHFCAVASGRSATIPVHHTHLRPKSLQVYNEVIPFISSLFLLKESYSCPFMCVCSGVWTNGVSCMKVRMNGMSICHGTNTVVAVARSSEKIVSLINITVFLDVSPYSLIGVYGHFGDTCCLRIQCPPSYREDEDSNFIRWLHSVTFQKTVFLEVIIVRNSGLSLVKVCGLL